MLQFFRELHKELNGLHFTSLQLVLSAEKRLPVLYYSADFLNFLWDHWTYSGYFETQMPLKPVLGGVHRLANYTAVYAEET